MLLRLGRLVVTAPPGGNTCNIDAARCAVQRKQLIAALREVFLSGRSRAAARCTAWCRSSGTWAAAFSTWPRACPLCADDSRESRALRARAGRLLAKRKAVTVSFVLALTLAAGGPQASPPGINVCLECHGDRALSGDAAEHGGPDAPCRWRHPSRLSLEGTRRGRPMQARRPRTPASRRRSKLRSSGWSRKP